MSDVCARIGAVGIRTVQDDPPGTNPERAYAQFIQRLQRLMDEVRESGVRAGSETEAPGGGWATTLPEAASRYNEEGFGRRRVLNRFDRVAESLERRVGKGRLRGIDVDIEVDLHDLYQRLRNLRREFLSRTSPP